MSFFLKFQTCLVVVLVGSGLSPAALADPPPVKAPAQGSGGPGEAPAEPPPLPAVQPQRAQALGVGRWPEGVAVTQQGIWVAQSGVRSVALLDRETGAVRSVHPVGRLPVALGVGPLATPVVQVVTDRWLRRISPESGAVSRIVRLPEVPEALVIAGNVAYSLLWRNKSSVGSSVLRVDLGSKAVLRSKDTGRDAFGITVAADQVWVLRSAGGLVALDRETLKLEGELALGGRARWIASAGDSVFVSVGEEVVRIAAARRKLTHRLTIPGGVQALSAWDDQVVAADPEGTLWILDPADLGVRARLAPEAPFVARAISRDQDTLLVTHHGPTGEAEGTLLRVPPPKR